MKPLSGGDELHGADVEMGICVLCAADTRKLVDFSGYSIFKCQNCGLAIKSRVFSLKREDIYAQYNEPSYWLESPDVCWQRVGYSEKREPRVKMWGRYLQIIERLVPSGRLLLDIGCASGGR